MNQPLKKQIQIVSKDNNYGLGELHPKEVGLIYMIRKLYRFGVVEITTQDGLPKQFRKREYTQMVPEGIPEIDPLSHLQETMEFINSLGRM